MKIIISHDVDHLYRRDHYYDLIFPKRMIRGVFELIKGEISAREYICRIWGMFRSQQHHINEVMAVDKKYNIPSTFFFGMNKGLGMNYTVKDAVPIMKDVKRNGFSIGVHGISYNDKKTMLAECHKFKEIFKNYDFGIRMHYVRQDDHTFEYLSEIGYLFDTSEFNKSKGHCFKNPYKINGMWEFPLCMMDGYLPKTLDEKKEATKRMLKHCENRGLKYFTILFHDYLYSEAFFTMREWYDWLLAYLEKQGYEFISYSDAMKELEKEA